jgi:hypothetical protein
MNFDTVNFGSEFRRGLHPEDIREETRNWSTLETYVYIIAKTFNPYSDNKDRKLNTKLHLVKVGFSSMKTRSGAEKLYGRMAGFRTSLISFKVHRFYLYEKDQNINESAEAHLAEKRLHERIGSLYKKATRIKFDSGNFSEWFSIAEKSTDRNRSRMCVRWL